MPGPEPPLRKLGVYLELVYTFPAIILLPALVGWWADKKFHSAPGFVLLGLFLGIAGGFTYLFKSLSAIGKNARR